MNLREIIHIGTKNKKPTSFGDAFLFLPVLEDVCAKMMLERLNNAKKPDWLFGVETPNDFNLLTFGQYSDLCDALGNTNQYELMKEILKIIFNVTDEQIDKESAYDIWGFCNFAIKETERINNIFSSIKIDYTEQEKRAGIEKMQFGTFGILDWYSKRMGIVDQNLVNNEKWVRIFQCMKNDNEEAAYNRRLQKVYESEMKKSSKH